jgi:hypothetical protein
VDLDPSRREGSGFAVMVKVWSGGILVAAAAPHTIRSLWLQPHLGDNIDKLKGVICSSKSLPNLAAARRIWWQRTFSGVGDLHRRLPLLCLWEKCGPLTRLLTFGSQPTTSSRLKEDPDDMHERSHHGADEQAFVIVHCVMPAHGRLCTASVHHKVGKSAKRKRGGKHSPSA